MVVSSCAHPLTRLDKFDLFFAATISFIGHNFTIVLFSNVYCAPMEACNTDVNDLCIGDHHLRTESEQWDALQMELMENPDLLSYRFGGLVKPGNSMAQY